MINYNISTTTEQVKINPIVEIKHEDLFVSSLNIAAVFGINHKNVLRDISIIIITYITNYYKNNLLA